MNGIRYSCPRGGTILRAARPQSVPSSPTAAHTSSALQGTSPPPIPRFRGQAQVVARSRRPVAAERGSGARAGRNSAPILTAASSNPRGDSSLALVHRTVPTRTAYRARGGTHHPARPRRARDLGRADVQERGLPVAIERGRRAGAVPRRSCRCRRALEMESHAPPHAGARRKEDSCRFCRICETNRDALPNEKPRSSSRSSGSNVYARMKHSRAPKAYPYPTMGKAKTLGARWRAPR
jgi:hypothetical protein